MVNNDFREDPNFNQNRIVEDPQDSRAVWLSLAAIVAVAIIALFAFANRSGDSDMDQGPMSVSETDETMMAPEGVEPAAEGDAVPATPDTAATDLTVDETAAPVETTTPVESTTSLQTYASEQECTAATDKPCHYVTCDSIPEGKQPDEVCGANFQKGWQPVVEATDKTTVPEEVAPPLSGQQNAPIEPEPPLTGQQ